METTDKAASEAAVGEELKALSSPDNRKFVPVKEED